MTRQHDALLPSTLRPTAFLVCCLLVLVLSGFDRNESYGGIRRAGSECVRHQLGLGGTTEYETRFSPATPNSPPTFICHLEAEPDEAAHVVIRRHRAKRWTGDLMTDLVVDRKLLCTEYFRVDERPWRPDEWDQVYEAPDPYSRLDSCTSDELVVLHNGPSERLGTIEVSIWRGIFRSHSIICTARKTSFDKFDTFEDDHLYPWYRFIFGYGTRNTLIANGIVSQDPIDHDLEAALRALENPDLLIEARCPSSPARPLLEVQASHPDPSPGLPDHSVETLRLPLASETHQPNSEQQPTAESFDSADSTRPPDGENVDALQTALNALFSETVFARQPYPPQSGVNATPAGPDRSPEPLTAAALSSPIDISLLSNPIFAPSRSINHIVPSNHPLPIPAPCRDQGRKPSVDPRRSRGQAQKSFTQVPLRTNHTDRATIPPESGTTCGKAQGQSARSKDASAVSASRRSQSDTKRRQAENTDSQRTRKPARTKIDVNARRPSWRDWKPTRFPAASRTNISPNDRVRAQSLRAADKRRAAVQVVPTSTSPSRYIDLTIDDTDDDEEYAARRELSKRATGRTAAEAIDLT
ncbi:hypothetical protein JCM24511_00314 [Saitozyma sp. JCM 24511]|nr:hypothetical protein JCM24511_00314 [Saitozyma sp. JCM 24511]